MALITCPECGQEISDSAQSCPHCGYQVQKAQPPYKMPPVQVPSSAPMKKRRGCLIPVIIFLILVAAFCGGIMKIAQNPEQYRAKSVLAKELELTAEQEAAMIDVFAQCGIGEITSAAKFQEGEGHTSYHLKDNETSAYKSGTIVVWVTDETKVVESIYFKDYDIYLDGAVVAQITDYYVNSADRDEYRAASQLAVNQLLNYPDTANYPAISGWVFGIEDGIVIIQSSVKAKNAFGMEENLSFQVKFENGDIISLVLDGTEYVQ